MLLLDEPTTHLDPPHQEDIARLLRAQARRGGVCVVSAIHDLSLALTADRLIVLGSRDSSVMAHSRGARRRLAVGRLCTRVSMVEHAGVYLWRPALETPPLSTPAAAVP